MAAAGGAAFDSTEQALVVKLKPKNRSGVTGTATITPVGEGVTIAVRLNKRVRGSLPSHLHIGPCKRDPNLNVWSTLKNVVKGRAVTKLTTSTLESLQAGRYSIHVHSPGYLLIACGDVPRT